MTKKTKRISSADAASARSLAKIMHRSPNTISKWIRKTNWPLPKNRRGPWSAADVKIICAWAEKTLAENPAKMDESRLASAQENAETRKLRRRMIAARTRLMEIEGDRKSGRLIDRSFVEKLVIDSFRTLADGLNQVRKLCPEADALITEAIAAAELQWRQNSAKEKEIG